MPGTIQVSVLEFVGLPSSLPPSSISVKVSIGEKEYQTLGKGDLSFPVQNLREEPIVTLLDAEGNVISHIGVKTMMVIEKGLWEDTCHLEGGGQVHMKLQFILSEEERNRIRIMRESALKKKYGESFDSKVKCPATAATDSNDDGGVSSLCLNHEAPVYSRGGNLLAALSSKEGELPASERKSIEKTSTRSPAVDVSERPLCSEQFSALLRCPDSDAAANSGSTFPKQERDVDDRSEKSLQERTPSNVRKMISTFESRVAQDVRSHANPPSASFLTEELPQTSIGTRNRRGQFGLLRSMDEAQPVQEEERLKLTAQIQTDVGHPGFENNVENKVISMKEERESPGYMMENYTSKSATVFGRTSNDSSHEPQLYNLQDSHKGTSKNKLKSVAYLEESFESCGSWIFPDEAGRLCLTTGGTKVMDLIRRDLNFLLPQYVEKHDLCGGADIEASRTEKNSPDPREPKLKRAAYAEAAGAPVGQAMKLATMIGFGTLVLLTAQRKT